VWRKIGFALFLWFHATAAVSQDQGLPFVEPEDPANTDIYLITVERGDVLWARFGHTIVRIFDHGARRTYNFNWGVFDFGEENFAFKFYRGKLWYKVALQNWSHVLATYQRYQKQAMVQEKLNLTTEQKRKIYKRIAWNSKPENIRYKYHYFYNNCSTKVRDYIDEALNGAIRDGIGAEKTDRTFRHHVREAMDGLWWADLGLEITTTSLYETQLTKWDEMFLPVYLREYLLNQPALDDNGDSIPGSKLLSDTKQIIEMPPVPGGYPPLYISLAVFGIPFLLSLGAMTWKKTSTDMRKFAVRLFGFSTVIFALFAGLFGVTMFLNWTVSGHPDLYHNANLWLFFPFDWFLVWIGFRCLLRGTWVRSAKGNNIAVMIAWLHVVGFFIAILGYGTGLIEQDISRVVTTLGEVVLMMAGGIIFLNHTSKQAKVIDGV
jgi:hypothetical protein